MCTYLIAVQPNGERLRYERWVYESWRFGMLNDPMLTQGLDDAVNCYWSHH